MKIRTVHPFPARMAPDIALRSLGGLPRNSVVLDPMVGSGTVVRQALALGHRAIGFDMDPLAVLMSRVWTSPIDVECVEAELERVIEDALAVDLRNTKLDWHDTETAEFVRYWFAAEQRRPLTRLAAVFARRRASSRLSDARRAAVDVLQVALSRTIVTKEQCASLARDTSHSRPHRVADKNDYDVIAGLRRSTASLLDRLREHPLRRQARVSLGDARALTLRTSSVDYILTSPPYLNQIDYMRGHRLSLVWFGYSLAQLRAIRGTTIGAERAGTACDHGIERIARAMCRADDLSSRHEQMVLRYAEDLQRLLTESARVLAPTGRAVFVVGNSCLKDEFIHNADGVAQAARLAGLRVVSRRVRELPQANRYLPLTSDGTLSKRMRTETVLKFAAA